MPHIYDIYCQIKRKVPNTVYTLATFLTRFRYAQILNTTKLKDQWWDEPVVLCKFQFTLE